METLKYATDATWLRFALEVLAVFAIGYCIYKQEKIQAWEEKHLHPILKRIKNNLLQKFFGKYIERRKEEEKVLAEEARENEAWDELLKELQ